jgi:hypothetical protein
VLFKVYSGGKYITCHKTTDSNGLALFKIPAKLDAGVHKIQHEIHCPDGVYIYGFEENKEN